MVSRSTIWNVLSGILVAAGIFVGSAALSAYDPCSIGTPCAEGTGLYPHTIECACQVDGSCEVITAGHVIQCACEEWPAFQCNCEDGCLAEQP
jgi:hypothetical protein